MTLSVSGMNMLTLVLLSYCCAWLTVVTNRVRASDGNLQVPMLDASDLSTGVIHGVWTENRAKLCPTLCGSAQVQLFFGAQTTGDQEIVWFDLFKIYAAGPRPSVLCNSSAAAG